MRLGRIFLLVAVLLIVVLALVFWGDLGGGGELSEADVAATAEAMETIPVVYLQQPVSRGETIQVEKVDINELKKGFDLANVYFNDVVDVVGKIARTDLAQGTYLTQNDVLDDPSQLLGTALGSEHSLLIPEGMVAVPVPINRFSSVAYGITRGDRVNVIATLGIVDLDVEFQSILPNNTAGVIAPGTNLILGNDLRSSEAGIDVGWEILFSDFFGNVVAQTGTGGMTSPKGRAELDSLLEQPMYLVPSEPQRTRIVSQTILQNVVVLHIGNFPLIDEEGREIEIIQPTQPPEGQQQQTELEPQAPSQQAPDIVTLVVWPQDAVTLNYLIYSGAELTLALRRVGDGSQTITDAVTLQYLLDVYRIPVPAKLPYGIQPRVDDPEPPVLENDIDLELED